MAKIRPLADRLIVRPAKAEDKIGSIIVPENAKEKPVRGEVLAVGNGRVLADGTRLPLDVKPGDVVLYGKYAGQDVRNAEEDLKMLKEEDVLAVVEPE
jgi:chaperonin GroES